MNKKNTTYLAVTIAFIMTFTVLPVRAADDLSLVRKLCAAYKDIETITCEVRKTTKGSDQTMRMLSRVYYKKDRLIHVDNVTPKKRRIICDGKTLWYYEAGAPDRKSTRLNSSHYS